MVKTKIEVCPESTSCTKTVQVRVSVQRFLGTAVIHLHATRDEVNNKSATNAEGPFQLLSEFDKTVKELSPQTKASYREIFSALQYY